MNNLEIKNHPAYYQQSIRSKNADIVYYKDEDLNSWCIEGLHSNKPGEGKKIVKRFVESIGENQSVHGGVIEPKTIERLGELGYLSWVFKTQKPMELTNNAILKSLKIVKTLRGGGININKLILSPDIAKNVEDYANEYGALVKIVGRT